MRSCIFILKCLYIHIWYFRVEAKVCNRHERELIQGNKGENFSLLKKFFAIYIVSRISPVSTVISAWRRACLCESFARACIHSSCTWIDNRSRYIGNNDSRDDRCGPDDVASYSSSMENHGICSSRCNVDNRTSRRCRAWIYLEELLLVIGSEKLSEHFCLKLINQRLINQRLDISIIHTCDSNRFRFGPQHTLDLEDTFIIVTHTQKTLFGKV